MGQREASYASANMARQESAQKDATCTGSGRRWSEIHAALNRVQRLQLQVQGGWQYAKLETAQKEGKNSNKLK